MHFGKFIRSVAPIAALAIVGAALSGCDWNVSIDGEEGKKLSELDLSGAPPSKVALFGPDNVKISEGDKLAITIDGNAEAAENLRFSLKDGKLGILRTKEWKSGEPVTINVTMPAPSEIAQMGSGRIEAAALKGDSKVVLMGSGDVDAKAISGDRFELDVLGSGSMHGGGTVKTLNLKVLGSGNADLAALRTDDADVDMLGSGSASFSSDGKVRAKIVGSGSITVKGRATCEVTSIGSGKLVCESGPPTQAKDDGEAPAAPEAPEAPEPPVEPKKN